MARWHLLRSAPGKRRLRPRLNNNVFRKKMINDKDPLADERDDVVGQSIPINDKRRFNDKGERIAVDDEKPQEAVKSPRETELENKLSAEMDRRLAAEAKLIG